MRDVMVNVNDDVATSEPEVAVIVYVAAACAVVGVPVTTPVAIFRLNPVGKAGETE